jgi:hypothetical protein
MKLNDRFGWFYFIYNLWYPAILGSMLYSVADFRLHQLADGYYAFRLLILVFYCVDYLHLYQDVRGKPGEQSARELVSDVVLAVLWRIAYSFAEVENYKLSLLVVAIVGVGLRLYLNRTTLQRWYIGLLASWLWICVVLSVLLRRENNDLWFFAGGLFVALVAYMVYVFRLFEPFVRKRGEYTGSSQRPEAEGASHRR